MFSSKLLHSEFIIKKTKNNIKTCWFCQCKCYSFVSICEDCKSIRCLKRKN